MKTLRRWWEQDRRSHLWIVAALTALGLLKEFVTNPFSFWWITISAGVLIFVKEISVPSVDVYHAYVHHLAKALLVNCQDCRAHRLPEGSPVGKLADDVKLERLREQVANSRLKKAIAQEAAASFAMDISSKHMASGKKVSQKQRTTLTASLAEAKASGDTSARFFSTKQGKKVAWYHHEEAEVD